MTDINEFHIEVQGNEIVVTMEGTNFKVIYYKPTGSPQLMAKWYSTKDKHAGEAKRAQFLSDAWRAANEKARELGWIV
jgi:hypothetical protein